MRLALLKFRCNEITDYTHLARSSVCQAINQLLNLKYHLGSNKHILKSSSSLTPQLWQHPCWPTNSLPPQYISCSGLNSSTTILLQTKGFFLQATLPAQKCCEEVKLENLTTNRITTESQLIWSSGQQYHHYIHYGPAQVHKGGMLINVLSFLPAQSINSSERKQSENLRSF